MTASAKTVQKRLTLLQLAERPGNVSTGCPSYSTPLPMKPLQFIPDSAHDVPAGFIFFLNEFPKCFFETRDRRFIPMAGGIFFPVGHVDQDFIYDLVDVLSSH